MPANLQDAYDLIHQGTLALAKVENNGIRIDTDYLEKTTARLSRKVRRLEESLRTDKIYDAWRRRYGSKANLGSRAQLAEVLFKVMKLPHPGYTERTSLVDDEGNFITPEDERHTRTDKASLGSIRLPFVQNYLQLEELKKALNTYLKGIAREVCDGYLHPSFNLHVVKSYRSCIAAGTLISTPEGTVPIECLQQGNWVLCYDSKLKLVQRRLLWAGRTGHKAVMLLDVCWHDGRRTCLLLTPEHKVRLEDGAYKPAAELDGHRVLGGRGIGIAWAKQVIGEEDVYDLEVEEHHNFIANGIVVMNSSSAPNFQNIPIRNPEIGKLIRQAFIPRKGRLLVEVDFSAIEVRVGYCYHKDPQMYKYLTDSTTDMHRDAAAGLYLLPQKEAAIKQIRYMGKNGFIFPEFYGSVWFQCAPALWHAAEKLSLSNGMPLRTHLAEKGFKTLGACNPQEKTVPGTYEAHVKAFEDDFWNNRFKVYGQWKRDWYDAYLERGHMDMLTGFRCSGLYRRNEVLNICVQGSAFHCLLWSLIQLQKWLEKHKMRSKITGQIHDSLLCDVVSSELQDVLHAAHHIMTQALPKAWPWITVAMETEAECSATNWHEKTPWVEQEGVWQPKTSK